MPRIHRPLFAIWAVIGLLTILAVLVFDLGVITASETLQVQYTPDDAYYYLVLAKNFTARRNVLPDSSGGRPPEYGVIVRPLPRSYDGHLIECTPPDHVETWQDQGLEFRAEFWHDLVLRNCKVSAENRVFTVIAIYDPRFKDPLVAGLSSEAERA